MPVPLITDTTLVDAAGWWNPLSTLANNNEAAITAETAARTTADAGEVTARNAAIAVETAARVAADTAEVTARNTAIGVETTNRTNADTAITNRLNSTIALTGISDLPTFKTATDTFTAAEPALRGVTKWKAVDETVNNVAVAQADDHLFWAVAANSTYRFTVELVYNTNATADLRVGWTAPAGATMAWSAMGLDSGLGFLASGNNALAAVLGFGGDATDRLAKLSGIFTTVATAGTLTLVWAQLAANVSNTIVRANSYGVLTKIA
jgi:hypothetical protein